MSHFTVLVVGDNVEHQLAPFQENNMGDCDPEYLEFMDCEDEYLAEYDKESTDRIVNIKTKEHFSPTDESFYRPAIIKEIEEIDNSTSSNPTGLNYVRKTDANGDRIIFVSYIPDGYKKKRMRYNKIYPTFEEYVLNVHGCERDPEFGRYGYRSNPNSKWDWYNIGGRWSGFFKLKPIISSNDSFSPLICDVDNANITYPDHKIGERGITNSDSIIESGLADQARVKDIDWPAMKTEAGYKAMTTYDRYMKYFKDIGPHKTWREIYESTDNIEEARTIYHNQPRCVEQKRLLDNPDELLSPDDDTFLTFLDHDKFLKSREEYIKFGEQDAFRTHALLVEGTWYQEGEMGWFGTISDKDESYYEIFDRIINSLPGDTLLTVVDCHV